MAKEITIFKNEKFGEIRTMTDENGETLFVGNDVARALGYVNPRKALQDHVDAEDRTDGVTIRDAIGRNQKMTVINESGLYCLILSSKLEQAKAFKRWVTATVLPQIRKTGGFIPTRDAEGRQLSNEEILQRAEQIVGKTLRLLNAPNENCMTATAVAKTWGMDVHSFNNLLRNMGIVYKKGGRMHLTEELQGLGLTEDRHFLFYSLRGKQRSRSYLVWTEPGVQYLNQRLMSSDAITPKVVQLNLFINN